MIFLLEMGKTLLSELHDKFYLGIFRDNNSGSEHFGQEYTINDVKLSPMGRMCFQASYDDGSAAPRL